MAKCETCRNAIFCAFWGEYKCAIREHMIYHPDLYADCEHYKEGKPMESKGNAQYEANLYAEE